MKRLFIYLVMILGSIVAFNYVVAAHPVVKKITEIDAVYYEGDCLESSPPGKCCHKDKSTGEMHCH